MSVAQTVVPTGTSRVVRRTMHFNALFALAGDILAKSSGLLILMVSARLLSTEQFAQLGVAVAAYGIITAVGDLGVSVLIQRDGAADPATRRALRAASLRARAPFALLTLVAAAAIGAWSGDLLLGLAVACAGLVGAYSLTLWAVVRAAEDFRHETQQRLVAGIAALVLAVAAAALTGRASAVILAMVAGSALVLPWMVRRADDASAPGAHVSGRHVLARAAPLGGLSMATLVYYRAPTILMGLLATSLATAQFTAAATIAFGLLTIANAITSGLLPRLAAEATARRRLGAARQSLGWALVGAGTLCAAVAGFGPLVLRLAFGPSFVGADEALTIMLAATVVISGASVIGTVLIAAGRLRWLIVQVIASMVVNVGAAIVLIGPLGASGAALATLASEILALLILLPAGRAVCPGLWRAPVGVIVAGVAAAGLCAAGLWLGDPLRPVACSVAAGVVALTHPLLRTIAARRVLSPLAHMGGLAYVALGGLACTFALWCWATLTDYGLRVISDHPSFLVIVRQLASRPLEPVSPFLAEGEIAHSHATPYTQALAYGWRWFGTDDLSDPYDVHPQALYRYLALVGLAVTALLVHSIWSFVRSQAGPRAAWGALSALLVLFGPAHVIWAGDLTFHSILYANYFPQGLALAFAMYAIVVLANGHAWWRIPTGALLCGACLSVHPFTGLLLALLLLALALRTAWARTPRAWRFGVAYAAGFALGSVWPVYSLDAAIAESGIGGVALSAIVIGLPLALVGIRRVASSRPLGPVVGRVARAVHGATAWVAGPATRPFAITSLIGVLGLIAYQAYLLTQPNPDPLITTNRLAVYWVEERQWWPALFIAGLVGLSGLARCMQRGRPVLAWWFAGAMGIGIAGILGAPIPVWWRFLLFAQVPLAAGVGVVLADGFAAREGWSGAARIASAALLAAAGMKLALLVAISPSLTYFNTPLQPSWRLGDIIPHSSGVVAADPFTSYLVSASSGHKVLTVTKAHVGSERELALSEEGYDLLHEFHSGDNWRAAAREMYARGVRYVVVEKSTSLRAKDLETFSTGPTPLIRDDADRDAIGVYYFRLNQVGELLYDTKPYTVYRLSPERIRAVNRPRGQRAG